MLINKVYHNTQSVSYSTADIFRPNTFLIDFEEFKKGNNGNDGSGLFK
jgi:hypothetical protein